MPIVDWGYVGKFVDRVAKTRRNASRLRGRRLYAHRLDDCHPHTAKATSGIRAAPGIRATPGIQATSGMWISPHAQFRPPLSMYSLGQSLHGPFSRTTLSHEPLARPACGPRELRRKNARSQILSLRRRPFLAVRPFRVQPRREIDVDRNFGSGRETPAKTPAWARGDGNDEDPEGVRRLWVSRPF